MESGDELYFGRFRLDLANACVQRGCRFIAPVRVEASAPTALSAAPAAALSGPPAGMVGRAAAMGDEVGLVEERCARLGRRRQFLQGSGLAE
jgi:hypothetical protein